MSVRQFNGTSDRIVVDNGIISQIGNGAFTLFTLVEPTTLNAGEAYLSCETGASAVAVLFDNAGGGGQLAAGDDVVYANGTVGETAGAWQILTVTVTGTGVVPRFHRKQLGTGSWTRINSGVTWTGNTVTTTQVSFGTLNNGAFSSWKDMRLAVAAVFNRALSDGELDAIETAATTQSIFDETPLGLWDFNQASVATDVLDLMGNGSNETIISGTTVINGDDPPGWVFGLGDAGTPDRRARRRHGRGTSW